MGALHFKGHLPEGVVLDWTVGTTSGNPDSNVTYGFTSSEPMGEQYAIAIQRVDIDGEWNLRQKTVTCIGPLAAGDFYKSREAGELVLDLESPNPTDVMAVRTASLDVPTKKTSEEVIGSILRLIFWKP